MQPDFFLHFAKYEKRINEKKIASLDGFHGNGAFYVFNQQRMLSQPVFSLFLTHTQYIYVYTCTHTYIITYITYTVKIYCQNLSKLESVLILLFASVNLPYQCAFPFSEKGKQYLNSCYDKYLENKKGANVLYFQNILQLHKSYEDFYFSNYWGF